MTVKRRREPVTSQSRNLLDKGVPIFKSGNVDWTKVRQGGIAGCPLPATLAAVARVCPSQIRGMLDPSNDIIAQKYVSWYDDEKETVRFEGDRLLRVHFHDARTVDITPRLYYYSGGGLIFAKAADGGGWVSYIEKAYVVLSGKHRYENLDAYKGANPPPVGQVFLELSGPYDLIQLGGDGKAGVFLNNDKEGTHGNAAYSKDYLKDFLARADTRPTIATTHSDCPNLIGDHTYVVLDRAGTSVKVWEAMHDSTEDVPLGDFWDEFDGVYQSRQSFCT